MTAQVHDKPVDQTNKGRDDDEDSIEAAFKIVAKNDSNCALEKKKQKRKRKTL